jgi:Cys-tRNA(Pro)/Cys-tRNA(Cys) deacylase
MRILEKLGIVYRAHFYDPSDGRIDGISVAKKIGLPQEAFYKTLVSRGADGEYYVFVIPVAGKLNLKRAAKAVDVKSVEMISAADINKVTGYVRGGCSPIGMKKEYVIVLDSTCNAAERIVVSAGKIGCQLELAPCDLVRITGARMESIATEN